MSTVRSKRAKAGLRVSIVIPVYNEAAYIAGCLDSIAAQSLQPDEVLVIDNNSTDGTAAIARRYDFVRVIREPVQGLVPARNRGFREAKGDIIVRIDADIRLPDTWLATGVEYLHARPEISAVSGRASFYNVGLQHFITWLHAFVYYRVQGLIAGGTILWGGAMLIRRSAAQAVLPDCAVDDRINEDIYLSLVMQRAGLQTMFLRSLVAHASLQRDRFHPVEVWRYLSLWHRNYQLLGMPVRTLIIRVLRAVLFAFVVVFGGVYLLLRPRQA